MSALKDQSNNNFEEFELLIHNMDSSSTRQVFQKLPIEDPEIFKLLLHSFIGKLINLSNDNSNELINNLEMITSSIKIIKNPISVLFLLLENLISKKYENYRISLLDILRRQEFSVMNIINLLYKNEIDNLVIDILANKEEIIDEFIRESIKIDHSTVAKNLSLILPNLNPKFFVNYSSFAFLFEKENHYLRNCFIDIIEALIFYFKDTCNLEAIKELTNYLSERLSDVNFYVRNKALGSISNLFKNESILKDQRNMLISEIIERTKDKTVIVRKKSINLLSQILLNHPFKNKESLERIESDLIENINTPGYEKDSNIEEDFNEFVILMEQTLQIMVSLLDYNLKTDIVEITTFIKIAYLLKLRGSKQAMHKTLGIVFTKERQMVVDVFKEILSKRGEILYEFINDKAFEVILSYLEVDEKIIFKNIYNGYKVFESIYVLKQIRKPISEQNALLLFEHITGLLFSSQNEVELRRNVKCYLNTLCIIRNLKYRIEHNHNILSLAIKNIIKMVFFERSLIKYTVELIYFISINPEQTIGKLIKNLSMCKSTLKIVDAIGWIALNQFYLLERFEKKFRRIGMDDKTVQRSSLADDSLREKRKSLEESRRSSLSRLSIDRKDTIFNDVRLSLRFDELEDNLKHKTDEEVADFFFYLKEREVLYSETSLLHQFMPILYSSLESENEAIQITAYSSLFKCMLISSEFFEQNLNHLHNALKHISPVVRNIALVSLHDFIIFFSSMIDSSLLFDKLEDTKVSKNALLIIYNLLQKNIIRIKNNSVKFISLLFDENLGPIVKTMIKSFAANNNMISIIFYETYLSELNVEYVKYLSSLINTNIQESLFLKCLKNISSDEKLQAVFESFELSEKFVKENLFRDELRQLVSMKQN